MKAYNTSDEVEKYRKNLPDSTRQQFDKLRAIVHSTLPEGEEKISYKIPSIVASGLHIIYFAGWAKHLSMYPVPEGDPELQLEMAPYKKGRGTLQFPLDKPLPEALIRRVIQYHIAERSKK